MKTVINAPPSGYVVPLSDMKAHLRIVGNDQDGLLQSLSLAAQQYLERATGWTLLETGWTGYYDDVDDIHLSKRPNLTINSISYLDSDGTEVVLDDADYEITRESLDVSVEITSNIDLGDYPNRIIVDYSVGYETAADIDELLKVAIKGLVAHWYTNPSPVVTGTIATTIPFWIEAIIDSYKVREV